MNDVVKWREARIEDIDKQLQEIGTVIATRIDGGLAMTHIDVVEVLTAMAVEASRLHTERHAHVEVIRELNDAAQRYADGLANTRTTLQEHLDG